MAEKSIRSVGIRQRNSTLGEDYQMGFDFSDVIDSERENATNYTLKDFFDNYIDFQSNSYNNVITDVTPVNKHVGIWFDTGHTNQEFPKFSYVTFDGNGGVWTYGLIYDTDFQVIQYKDKFTGPVPQNIAKKDRFFLGWYVDEIHVWSKVEDILSYPVHDGTVFYAQWAKLEVSADTDISTTKGKTITIPVTASFVAETEGITVPDLNIDLTDKIKLEIDSNIGYSVEKQNDTTYNVVVTIPQTVSGGETIEATLVVYDQKIDFNIFIENTFQLLVTKSVSQVDNEYGIVLNVPAPLPLQALDVYPNINNPEWLKVGNGIHGTIYLNNLDFYESTSSRAPTWPGSSVSSLPVVKFDSSKYKLALDTGNASIVFFSDSYYSLAEYQKYIQTTIWQESDGVLRYSVQFVSSRINMIDDMITQFLQKNIDNIAFAIPVLA